MAIRNKLFAFFLTVITYISHNEGYKLTIYEQDRCAGTIMPSGSYYFTRPGTIDTLRPDTNGIVTLPEKGIYDLHFWLVDYPVKYHFNGQISDTLNFPNIIPGHTRKDKGFMMCIKYEGGFPVYDYVNGKAIDFFKADKKRLEGTFKNGQIIGKLIYYDLDGKIVRVEHGKPERKKHKRHKM